MPGTTPYPLNSNGEPDFRRSFVLFLDILGYSAMAADLTEIRRLRQALIKNRSVLVGEDREQEWQGAFAIRTFTDNVVIGFPIRNDGEDEYISVVNNVATYQLNLALEDVFVRGGLAVGDHFMDDYVVTGPALIEAYKFESQVAVSPRIALGPTAVALCRQHMRYYGHPSYSYQNITLLRDGDGQVFLNYLYAAMPASREEMGREFDDVMLSHRAVIEQRLARHVADPRVWSKYAWLGRYHNYVMPSLVGVQDAAGFLIEPARLVPSMRPFMDS